MEDEFLPLSNFTYGDILERDDKLTNLLVIWADSHSDNFKGLVSLDNPSQTWRSPLDTHYKKIGTLSLAANKALPYKIVAPPKEDSPTMDSVPVGTLYTIPSFQWIYLKVAVNKHVIWETSQDYISDRVAARIKRFGEDITSGWGDLVNQEVNPVGFIKGFAA